MIGVFDSGYGGLTVLKELLKELPQYDYLYLGDNARAPYGNLSTETLISFTDEIVEYLFEKGCKVIIIACNTLSSNALRHVQEKYLRKPSITNRKILGVIKPLVEEATKVTRNLHIGLVGTRSTVHAKTYEIELQKINPDFKIFTQACPLLVPLIEENWYKKPEARMILKKYLRPLKSANIDTLILGCTHYPILQHEFEKAMGKNIQILRSGEIVAKSFQNYLLRHPEIEQLLTRNGKRFFETTDDPKRFDEMGSIFLGQKIDTTQKINLRAKQS